MRKTQLDRIELGVPVGDRNRKGVKCFELFIGLNDNGWSSPFFGWILWEEEKRSTVTSLEYGNEAYNGNTRITTGGCKALW